jgi:predicted transcriptional regulator
VENAMPATIKENVIEMIRRMPNDATVTDIMAELYVRQKVDAGLSQLDNGQSLSHEEVEQRLSRWLS